MITILFKKTIHTISPLSSRGCRVSIYSALTFALAMMISSSMCAQNKRDYLWLFGSDPSNPNNITSYHIDFKDEDFKLVSAFNGLDFDSQNASICDEDGNLLFYTNGCAVANAKHDTLLNGDRINDGLFFQEIWLNDCGLGYPGFQDVIILTDPANSLGYYIIHKPQVFVPNADPDVFSRDILFSYVDMTLDDGLGGIIDKNEIIFNKDKILSSYLTAIQHQNGKDWWIIQPKNNDNVYYTFLLDSNGIHLNQEQKIGPVFDSWGASASGTAKFSPDGTKYAYYNVYDQLLLYDFNRSTGVLSNLKQASVDVVDDRAVFSSVEWSPNSRFLYLASEEYLYQLDLLEENLEDGVVLIDTYNGVADPFPTPFFLMALAPDCKIYMCTTSSAEHYHVIKKPNQKGKACDFVQQGIKLPHISGVASMPNFPRFRVDEQDVCDSTITSIFGQQVFYRKDLKAYPNPASDIIHVDMPDQHSIGILSVYNSEGSLVKNLSIEKNEISRTLDVFNLATGFYHVEFIPNINPNRNIYSATFNIAH